MSKMETLYKPKSLSNSFVVEAMRQDKRITDFGKLGESRVFMYRAEGHNVLIALNPLGEEPIRMLTEHADESSLIARFVTEAYLHRNLGIDIRPQEVAEASTSR
jgi:hypothetical protein